MESPEKSTEKSTCESCGKSFDCGAKTGSCWCFSIAIEPQDLAQLNQQFQNCLCQECLQNSFSPITSNEKTKDS
jgi:Cysteine-rich CWC